MICLFVCLSEVLRPGQQFSVILGRLLGNGDEVSCSKTQPRAPGEDRTRDLAIVSPTLSQLIYQCYQISFRYTVFVLGAFRVSSPEPETHSELKGQEPSIKAKGSEKWPVCSLVPYCQHAAFITEIKECQALTQLNSVKFGTLFL